MPHNPLDALRKAQTIGPNPLAEENWLRGEMPLGPLAGPLEGLKRALPALEEIPDALRGIGTFAGPRVQGITRPVSQYADELFRKYIASQVR